MSLLFLLIRMTTESAMSGMWSDLSNKPQHIPVVPHAQPWFNYSCMPVILALFHGIGLQSQKEIFTTFSNISWKYSGRDIMTENQWGIHPWGPFPPGSNWPMITTFLINDTLQHGCLSLRCEHMIKSFSMGKSGLFYNAEKDQIK